MGGKGIEPRTALLKPAASRDFAAMLYSNQGLNYLAELVERFDLASHNNLITGVQNSVRKGWLVLAVALGDRNHSHTVIGTNLQIGQGLDIE